MTKAKGDEPLAAKAALGKKDGLTYNEAKNVSGIGDLLLINRKALVGRALRPVQAQCESIFVHLE